MKTQTAPTLKELLPFADRLRKQSRRIERRLQVMVSGNFPDYERAVCEKALTENNKDRAAVEIMIDERLALLPIEIVFNAIITQQP